MTLADRIVVVKFVDVSDIVIVVFVANNIDNIGVRVRGPGSGNVEFGFRLDPPERSGVGVN